MLYFWTKGSRKKNSKFKVPIRFKTLFTAFSLQLLFGGIFSGIIIRTGNTRLGVDKVKPKGWFKSSLIKIDYGTYLNIIQKRLFIIIYRKVENRATIFALLYQKFDRPKILYKLRTKNLISISVFCY